MSSPAGNRGQASVELVALLPLAALVLALAWQAVVAGQAAWLAGAAARKAARAHAIGADAGEAARSVLSGTMRSGARVRPRADGTVTVTVPIPLVVGGGRLGSVDARAHFEPQES